MNGNWTDSRTFRILETAFYVGSMYCTLLSGLAFALVFYGVVTVDDFSTVNNLYWPSLLMYSTMRKSRRSQHPTEVPHRSSEMLLLFWMVVGLVGMTITLAFRREMFPLMKEFGLLYLILLGIFLGGKAVEQLVGSILGAKK